MGGIQVKEQGRGGAFARSAAPDLLRWLLGALKIEAIVSGDDQRVGREGSPRSFRSRGYRVLLLIYKTDK